MKLQNLDYENMSKGQAIQYLDDLNAMCVMMERTGIDYTFDQVIEIKTRQKKLEDVIKGLKVKNDQ